VGPAHRSGHGEALWDLLADGPHTGEEPADFACHAAMLGTDAFAVSRADNDELGDRAITACTRQS
jgi:sugar/nucleoside kinase (ribokinase family)